MHVHKDKGISEILLIKLVKTRGTLRGFVCSYDNNDAGNGVGYMHNRDKLFFKSYLKSLIMLLLPFTVFPRIVSVLE
jgi:hypothetical protein